MIESELYKYFTNLNLKGKRFRVSLKPKTIRPHCRTFFFKDFEFYTHWGLMYLTVYDKTEYSNIEDQSCGNLVFNIGEKNSNKHLKLKKYRVTKSITIGDIMNGENLDGEN